MSLSLSNSFVFFHFSFRFHAVVFVFVPLVLLAIFNSFLIRSVQRGMQWRKRHASALHGSGGPLTQPPLPPPQTASEADAPISTPPPASAPVGQGNNSRHDCVLSLKQQSKGHEVRKLFFALFFAVGPLLRPTL